MKPKNISFIFAVLLFVGIVGFLPVFAAQKEKSRVSTTKVRIAYRTGPGQARHPWKLSSRGGFGSHPYLDMEATGYDPGPISCGPHANGYTATMMKAAHGVVAVDPRVIPLGTRLYIDGYGYAVAADIGGAIKGNRIDLCFNTYGEAIQFGRRMVRVYFLGR